MVTETAILNPKVVNETRFQFTRNLTQSQRQPDSQHQRVRRVHHRRQRHRQPARSGPTLRAAPTTPTSCTARTRSVSACACAAKAIRISTRKASTAPSLSAAARCRVLDASNNIVLGRIGQSRPDAPDGARAVHSQPATACRPDSTRRRSSSSGGGPTKFSIQAGQPYISMVRWDAGPFVQDDWRIRPNFTLSLGLRYEVQNSVSDHRDIAPRVGFAWAPGSAKNGRQKTVIRGGVRHLLRPHRFRAFRERPPQ